MKFKNILLLLVTGLMISNCMAQKEITVPCTDKGKSDAHYFRASSSAKSKDLSMSKDKSMVSTKQVLASLIGSTMKSITENYTSQLDQSKVTTVKSSFENLITEVVNQQLKFVSITCQTTNKTKDGYETFTAIEVPKDDFFRTFTSKVTSDNNLKVDFDESKFREIFDKQNNLNQ